MGTRTRTRKPDREAKPLGDALRRYLTILFSDLSDSARLVAGLEAEDYADLLARLRRAYEEVIAKHGGTIIQIVGDGIFAAFGYPDAREDDGRRATEAALDLHDVVRGLRFDFPLPTKESLHLHTGIHSGLVLIGEGDPVSGPIRLFGNAVNVAARLSDAAAGDEIFVSKETLGAERHFFQSKSERTLKLHGIDDPITICCIKGRAPIGTRFEARAKRGLTPFVGRQPELQTLLEILQSTIAGRPRYVAIVAPAGVGKTRLAEAFLSLATTLDCQIRRGYCESYLSAEPMQPFLQILRSLCGFNYGMSTALADRALQRTLLGIDPALMAYRSALLRALSLGSPVGTESKADGPAPETTVAAMGRLFEALATAKPLVLFIDDWQWADDATRQVVAAIRNLGQRAIFVLVATRDSAPGDVIMTDAQILNLMPLSGDETEQTIARLLPGTNKFVVVNIREYSGGNPLFIEELCHSAEHNRADHGSRGPPIGEAWLDKLIEARVARLPPAQIELVHTAAVIGNVFPVWVFERLTGYRADHPLVLALTEKDLIYQGEQEGTLRFKHGIARDVIYHSVGLRQRKAMHRQIAEMFKQQVSSCLEEEPYEFTCLSLCRQRGGEGGGALRRVGGR